jgi:uncharacterized DUF497 family protein
MHYTWDESKRLLNLKKHGLDFVDAFRVFEKYVLLYEDDRMDYDEQRMIAYGVLDGHVVVVVHVESDDCIRVISMRRADRDESDLYYRHTGYII